MFVIICVLSIFSYTYQLVDTHILPKWYYSLIAIMLAAIIVSVKLLCNKKVVFDLYIACGIIVSIVLIQAISGICQRFSNHAMNMGTFIGSFDNPAGFAACICVGFPFTYALIRRMSCNLRGKIYLLVSVTIIVSICLSGSRTGLICVVFTLLFFFWKKMRLNSMIQRSLFIVSIMIFFSLVYYAKKDSADGRLLIWKCTLEMIKDDIWTGQGRGAFRRNYMDYQANYFKSQSSEHERLLADNVLHPFNEFLNVFVQYGLLGLLVLFMAIGILMKCSRVRTPLQRSAVVSLIVLAFFSLFSYPFKYPFSWYVMFYSFYLLVKDSFQLKNTKLISVVLIILCMVGLFNLVRCLYTDMQWKKIAYQKPSENVMVKYWDLYSKLMENPSFLYNYAVFLYDAKLFNQSLIVAMKCDEYWGDYELELLQGKIYKELGDFESAILHFQTASFMCPCRFVPLYYQFQIFRDWNRLEESRNIAFQIISKPVKVNSYVVEKIRYQAKLFIDGSK